MFNKNKDKIHTAYCPLVFDLWDYIIVKMNACQMISPLFHRATRKLKFYMSNQSYLHFQWPVLVTHNNLGQFSIKSYFAVLDVHNFRCLSHVCISNAKPGHRKNFTKNLRNGTRRYYVPGNTDECRVHHPSYRFVCGRG